MISILNNGAGVPVEIHKEEQIYVPELIFGHLLTSSNYDDTQKKAGRSTCLMHPLHVCWSHLYVDLVFLLALMLIVLLAWPVVQASALQ